MRGRRSSTTGVDLVEVGDDGDPGFAGPAGGEGGRGGVVAVDVKGAGVDDPIALQVGGLEVEALVLAPEHGALAVAVDEDQGLAGGAVGHGDNFGLDAGMGEGLVVKGGSNIVAERADVAGGEAPLLAGDDG